MRFLSPFRAVAGQVLSPNVDRSLAGPMPDVTNGCPSPAVYLFLGKEDEHADSDTRPLRRPLSPVPTGEPESGRLGFGRPGLAPW